MEAKVSNIHGMHLFQNIDFSRHAAIAIFLKPATCSCWPRALLPGPSLRIAIEAQGWTITAHHRTNTALQRHLLEGGYSHRYSDLSVNLGPDVGQEAPQPHHLRLQRAVALQPPQELLVGGTELPDLLLQESRARLLLLPVLAHGLPVDQRPPGLRGRVAIVVFAAGGEDLGVRVLAGVRVHGGRWAGSVAGVRVAAGAG